MGKISFMITLLVLAILSAIPTLAIPTNSKHGNNVCAKWCADHFSDSGHGHGHSGCDHLGPDKHSKHKSDCTSLAAKGQGPCYECGPAAPSVNATTKMILCDKVCIPVDNNNCGGCGITCTNGETCKEGHCVSPPCNLNGQLCDFDHPELCCTGSCCASTLSPVCCGPF